MKTMLLLDRLNERLKGRDFDGPLPGLFDPFACHDLVYEVTDVVKLFDSWQAEKDKKVPRRPPGDRVWCEWVADYRSSANPEFNGQWEVGAEIWRHPEGADLGRVKDAATRDWMLQWDELWTTSLYHRFLPGQLTCPPGITAGMPLVGRSIFMTGLSDGGTAWDTTIYDLSSLDDLAKAYFPYGVGVTDVCSDESVNSGFAHPWPAFMAFALLHCKNVVAEDNEPGERIQRECRKHGRPPRVTYKTLKIEVPQATHKRQGYSEQEDGGPKVRFHLCSGHFKNLQHPRFKNKGWHWWPAHWRGSKELGEVRKTYKLQPAAALGNGEEADP
jgi:hypothetical protein